MITPFRFYSFRKLTFLFFLVGFFSNISIAQKVEKFIGEKTTTNHQADLVSIFFDYDVYQINSNDLASYVSNAGPNPMMLNIELGDQYNWNILMYENELMSDNYQLTEKSDNGNSFNERGNFKTLSGHLQGAQGGDVYLTINNHFIFGMVHNGDQSYFIEPLNGIISDASQDLFVVYNTKNVVPNTGITCGVTDIAKYKVTEQQETQGMSVQMDPCSELEMALAADRSMFNKYGSIGDVENYLIGIWNLVAPDYTGWFSQDIEFKIVTTFVVSGQDPWTSTTDASTLLSDFRSWGNNGNFGVAFDLGQLWSDRNFTNDGNSSVVGLAYVGVVCTNSRYSIIEDFSGNSNAMRQTVSHEVGHNFDAGHDSGGSNIMAPTINGSSTWSTTSVSEISSHIDTRTCFEDCLKCIEITSVEVQNCGGGTYDLEVCIEHTGRTNQSVLKIDANGTTTNFSFNNSGVQCETLTGLPANSTANAILIVEDSNDNDSECTKTFNYDAPHPNCVCSPIISEDFNALSLPAGWTNVGTGNNGNGEWDFDNATGGVNSAAGSFDGSGMAFWDDDANGATFNGSEYMELTTPTIDLTNYELVSLDFDYNFWTFDGQDRFLVDVWDGFSWVNLLNTNETNCGPWGCDYPHFRANLDNYANPNFRLRFTYDDSGNSWQWWVAIDNVEICGFELAPLAVDLIEFNAVDEDCTIELDWKIANETSDVFEIERSFDGQNFEVIGTINGLTNPNKNYHFTDTHPGYENFYRLKTTTQDGQVDYSTIKSVTATSCKEGVIDILDVYPNPTRGDLFYNIHSNENVTAVVEIRNTTGALVDIFNIDLEIGLNNKVINTDNLATGLYYLKMTGEFGTTSIKKFVKD